MIRKRKNFLVYKTKRYLIFLFCSKLIFSQSVSYYSKSVNPGKSDEFTQDFTIYRIGKEIRASYRTISGRYDSPNCYYFGEADTVNQNIIYLNSICSSEGESYDGGKIKVEFKLNNSQLNVNGEILKKAEQYKSFEDKFNLMFAYNNSNTRDDFLYEFGNIEVIEKMKKRELKEQERIMKLVKKSNEEANLKREQFKKKEKEEKKEKPKNLKLIALCLVYEVANADNDIDIREKDLILEKIKESVDVSVLTEKEIFDVIQEESQKRVSFYDIIHDINKNLDKKEKVDVLKMLWEIAYADKVLDVDEERIIRRSAEMLGIKPSIVLKTKEEFKNQ